MIMHRSELMNYNVIFSAKNSAGSTSTEVNGDLELTVNINDVNDNDPIFNPPSKCTEMANGTSGRKCFCLSCLSTKGRR